MIVIGTDPHKQSFTFALVVAGTGELRSSETVPATTDGFLRARAWADRHADALEGRDEVVWAIEDCRHVSGRLERFLLACGARVVRVPPRLMAGARRGGRQRGKSDEIDAVAVARAALREGVDTLPSASLDPDALDLRLLLDHHDDLVRGRTGDQSRLRWHLHELECPIEVPTGGLDRKVWLSKLQRWLSRPERRDEVRVRVARTLVARIAGDTRQVAALIREIHERVDDYRPELLGIVGCGPLTAAKIVGETAGAERFGTDAQFARMAGVAPIPVSSGRTDRFRLDRGGNRQLNLALHRIAVNQGRRHPPAQEFLARKQAEGKSRMEALRCLKRHLARTVLNTLKTQDRTLDTAPALT
ncbi:MAG: IS110 family transposase [Patulibacter sp.]|nr:IS110 family transposase [Patulibacter sp.]